MNSDQRDSVEEIFLQVIAAPAGSRSATLKELCGPDQALRDQVQQLLEFDARVPADFMRVREVSTTAGDDAAPPGQELLGSRVGDFLLETVIGQGGMGTVFLARQTPPDRQVAFKLLNSQTLRRSAGRRFERETQILASLHHPHIAQLYACGLTPDRNPYFAMELVLEAATLTSFAQSRNLSMRQRLELFLQLCDAVHYGHQRGIIHRDLKPSNVLVDTNGHVKVIDFGVARSLDVQEGGQTLATRPGEIVGTLQYMSPEQLSASPSEVDIRCDVYALGVVLYELLTDQVPYDVSGLTIYGATRVILEHVPARPRVLNRRCHRDVETIVMKALAKQPTARYQSVAQLREDIGRFLRGDPISARPPRWHDRIVRCVARHPLAVTAITCGAMILFTVLGVYLGLEKVRSMPKSIQLTTDRRSVSVTSISGNRLLDKSFPELGAITSAELVEHPATRGAVAILAVQETGEEDFPPGVYAFDVAGGGNAIRWKKHVDLGDVPAEAPEHDYAGEIFVPRILLQADVFPETSGQEVLVQHVFGRHSQTLFCVYSAGDGGVLYQFWHDGQSSPGACFWMPRAGLLVISALNGSATRTERGLPAAQPEHPVVLFAVRPKLNVHLDRFPDTRPDPGGDFPAWYYFLDVVDTTGIATVSLETTPAPGGTRSTVEVVVNWCKGGVTENILRDTDTVPLFSWTLDDRGRVTGNPHQTTAMQTHAGILPAASTFSLRPLPPIVKPAQVAQPASREKTANP